MVDTKDRLNQKGLGSNLKKGKDGELPPVTKTPAAGKLGGGGFFLTETAALSQTPAAKKNFSLSVGKATARNVSAIGGHLEGSPSQMSMTGGIPYNRNLDDLIAAERRRAFNQTTKQKEIVALNYALEKQRVKDLKIKLDKKALEAEKVLKRENKIK